LIASSELDLEEILLIEEEPVSRPGKLATWPKLAFLEHSGKFLSSFAFPTVKFNYHFSYIFALWTDCKLRRNQLLYLKRRKALISLYILTKNACIMGRLLYAEKIRSLVCRICIFIYVETFM
jgi:hypothetical protein